jgi:hypothetical protein
MSKSLVPVTDDQGELVVKPTPVQVMAQAMNGLYTVIQFRNRPMVMVDEPYPYFQPLTKEKFDRMFYYAQPGQTRSRVGDVYAQVCYGATDYSGYDHMILFGRYDIPKGEDSPPNHPDSALSVWDTKEVGTDTGFPPAQCVWRCPYAKIPLGQDENGKANRIPFIMELACGDEDIYDDIMFSIAPVVMDRKPDGVIWWIGDGANGKSTLMDALYRLFPGQLSSLTVKRLVDSRDTPALNGTLANIVKESSEGRIDDTEIYKSLGTHESFPVHKFHSQEPITINGNIHHIFSGNQVPVFNDKGFSARRRTHIIPFNARFESDPAFEDRTFTPKFFGGLAAEICRYAVRLKRLGYRYNFSAKTMAAKADYDTEANNAEEYANELVKTDGVVAFDNFNDVRNDYENWCRENGYVELGKGYMRRAILACGFERVSIQIEGKIGKRYKLPDVENKELRTLGGFRLGLYTYGDFTPEPKEEKPAVPQFSEPVAVADMVEARGGDWS